MKIEAGKVYRRADDARVHIMGPTSRDDGVPAFWSLEGNHYTEGGRMLPWLAAHYELVEEIGQHSDGGKGAGWAHSECSVCYLRAQPAPPTSGDTVHLLAVDAAAAASHYRRAASLALVQDSDGWAAWWYGQQADRVERAGLAARGVTALPQPDEVMATARAARAAGA